MKAFQRGNFAATLTAFLASFLLLNISVKCDTIVVVDLEGDQWTAVNANGSIRVSATVPGDIYTDLERNGILNDSYYRFNDIDYRWVSYDNWTYSTQFQVGSDVLAKSHVYLVAEGLDTVSAVYLNGKEVGQSNDMFVRYRWDIKQILNEGSNNLSIAFTSPITYAASQWQLYQSTYSYDVPPDCTASVQNGECHVNFIRKIQSQFSWDWGPAFPTMGVWQPIYLEAVNTCLIRDILVYPAKEATSWTLGIGVYFDCSSTDPVQGSMSYQLSTSPPWSLNAIYTLQPDSNGVAFLNITGMLSTQNIDPWWPNGYGNQTLYNLNVSFADASGNEPSTKTIRVGFRTIELIQDPINPTNTSAGDYFYFKINGVPVFMKGSNWIPASSFPTRVTKEYLRNLLQSAADAHMNSLRVWGGGQYEKEEFYDLTDELGILIWEDLMFACGMYPVDEPFLDAVSTEITQQIRRLQHRPSILLWSGNNENEAALAQNWYGTNSNYNQYFSDYVELYVSTAMTIVEKEDMTRPYITSSPSNGVESVSEGYVAKNPADSKYGDVHYYTYTQDGWNWQIYPRPRFVSEYGFQSWPSFETLSKVSIDEDWDYTSKFMESRQHHGMGNLEIILGVQLHMSLPTGCTYNTPLITPRSSLAIMVSNMLHFGNKQTSCQTVDGFKGILYQTQIYQAMSIKTETEYYRRARNELVDNQGYTMGTLYWQLDDIWQGASWSSLEYGGKWKILHYYALNFYSPILVSPFLNTDGTYEVYAISDTTSTFSGTLTTYVYRWSSFTPAYQTSSSVDVIANSAVKVVEQSTSELYQSSNCTAEECFFYFTLDKDSSTKDVSPPNFIFPTSFKKVIGLTKANITISNVASTSDANSFQLTLESTAIAPFVWLEATNINGRFSDNGFVMVKPSRVIEFYSWESVDAEKLMSSLIVKSLMDLY